MRSTSWALGAVWWGMACSGGQGTPTERALPVVDPFGVRIGGGESADFGNGSDDYCGSSSTDTVLSEEQARQAGLDIEGDRAWLALPHRAVLAWNPKDCEVAPGLCEPTRVELRARVVEPLLVEGRSGRPSAECEAEWQGFAYRAALSVKSEDGNLEGTFYARVSRRESADGALSVRGHALPDLRNFAGRLPLEFELSRPHFAYLDILFSLSNDGGATGQLEPFASYYDEGPSSERIGPDASFAPDPAQAARLNASAVLTPGGATSTLSTYPGSGVAPQVALEVRAEAVQPAAEVQLLVWVDGEPVHDQLVAAGTRLDLGLHPFGTEVRAEVVNVNGAGTVGANISQDRCTGASSSCTTPDCTAHAEYTAAHHPCAIY